MKSSCFHLAVCIGLLASALLPSQTNAKSLGWNADTLSQELAAIKNLPAPPDDVTHLRFSDFFISPSGPRGLEYTAAIKRLDGQRVRILGFMVRQTRPAPGTVLLASYASFTHEGEYGLCDDLPPATLFVRVPKYADLAVPFTPGPLLLTGKLELGPRQETDGRISHVRLVLDPENILPSVAAANEPHKTVTHAD
ncbi:MAG: hypothetical protein QM715_09245 [Nibricoccus sp.]